MKQKSSRVLTEKTENGSVGNAQAQRRNRICPKAPTENGSREKRVEADRGVHMSGLKSSPAPEGCGLSLRHLCEPEREAVGY